MVAVRALIVFGCATACTVGGESDELDADMLESAGGYGAMSRVNAAAYPSDLGDSQINCYIEGDVAKYREIHPERTGSKVRVAPGTTIVREVLDGGGGVAKLTVMAKGPPGYDPRLGDWGFAVTDPRGVPLVENGQVLVGRLTQCHGCHVDRPDDDFLFGVPTAQLRRRSD